MVQMPDEKPMWTVPVNYERMAHLEQMVKWAAEGRCMACGSLFAQSRCDNMKCSKNVFNDTMSQEFEMDWHARKKILAELKG